MSLLSTQKIGIAFGGLKAVRNVDFTLETGEIRAIIGPNGAGKTTFVSLLSGRLRPDQGEVAFEDRIITHLAAHRRVRLGIAYTFQITSIYPRLRVFDNVAIAAEGVAAPGAASMTIAQNALIRTGLADKADEIAGQLAYGHQRLLEVSMGLAVGPKLLILDEPTQGLSDGEIDDFCALIRALSDNTTVLLIEHNMDVVMQLADRITVMDRGEVLAEGSSNEIRANRRVQAAYLGT